jgi:hypothetical protein
MTEVYDEEDRPESREERGTFFGKCTVLLCLGAMLIGGLAVVYSYLKPMSYPTSSSFDPTIIIVFIIGFVVGWIVREGTKK